MKTIAITETTIAKLEAKGFHRWTKNGMDRLYINAESYGLHVECYKSGNFRRCEFQGVKVSNADGHRIDGTKAYIDLANGQLYIQTSYYYAEDIREAIEAIIAEVEEEVKAEEKAARAEEEKEAEEMSVTESIDWSDPATVREDTYGIAELDEDGTGGAPILITELDWAIYALTVMNHGMASDEDLRELREEREIMEGHVETLRSMYEDGVADDDTAAYMDYLAGRR